MVDPTHSNAVILLRRNDVRFEINLTRRQWDALDQLQARSQAEFQHRMRQNAEEMFGPERRPAPNSPGAPGGDQSAGAKDGQGAPDGNAPQNAPNPNTAPPAGGVETEGDQNAPARSPQLR